MRNRKESKEKRIHRKKLEEVANKENNRERAEEKTNWYRLMKKREYEFTEGSGREGKVENVERKLWHELLLFVRSEHQL
jgi:hypothetical protein